ncbi:MAG: tRNA (5-methylaminomethyl-2-thiouridine)(34)-methyltransferase MnmD [Bacteroidales bacterium]|jgi:tRNA U34 5-methylaminomethyl-2-thiouridine-forming methyltransferase MnmC
MNIQPIITKDGSSTLFIPELNEHYHSIHGAVQESMHIFIQNGYSQIHASSIRIFEAGFGTGLNTYLTMLTAEQERKTVHYTSVEKYPLGENVVKLLNYTEKADVKKAKVFQALHDAQWDIDVNISDHFTLFKMRGDLKDLKLQDSIYDLVYFDAFGPDVQPDLWTEEIFTVLFRSMKKNACLVTYSVKGSVKRALKTAGFILEKLPGPPGKREITRATKKE